MPNERVSMSKLKQLIGLQSSNLSVRGRLAIRSRTRRPRVRHRSTDQGR